LLANRIALLKQEEMKTWKKIEDTRKRTNEIVSLKNRNEDRIRMVSLIKEPPPPRVRPRTNLSCLPMFVERKRNAG
jgi:hypothetical protein